MTKNLSLFYDHIITPIGTMEFVADNSALLAINFVERANSRCANKITDLAKKQLWLYFDGALTDFDLPIQAEGTKFQKSVWQALTTIEYGQTASYGEIASKIHNPKAVRAVGTANSRNPMTIVVPCHRIIGSNGALTGYASGIERKSWLLNHEAKTLK
ncbi:MAG: methylated-DNA--[protein]-cysteine S-methyltransferase [Acidiferrobacterales bacterium]|nr:methylated-DNA--[protein]-cysteine S-methyltransferase [Acidiferrobacterales bacterium]